MEFNSDDLYQVALLIDQLKHEDSQLRIHAINSLPRIALTLGPDRTRNELVPFLKECTDDEDELLIILSKKIYEIRHLMGGIAYMHLLFQPLERLASGEESSVRDATIQAIKSIANDSKDSEDFYEHYKSFYLKLSNKDWYTSRITSSFIFESLYALAPSNDHVNLRSTFYRLLEDESPLVRRAAADTLSHMIRKLENTLIINEAIPSIQKLANDDQDCVKVQIIPSCISVGETLKPTEYPIDKVLHVVFSIASDKCWRVRWSFCEKFPKICSVFCNDSNRNNFGDLIENLLLDSEAEVRAASSMMIASVFVYFNKDLIINKLMFCIRKLVNDPSEHVRICLSCRINDLARDMDKTETLELLLPILLLLLRDENVEVRLNVISSLDTVSKSIGMEVLGQTLLPAIINLAGDAKWRIRLSIAEKIPDIIQQLGKVFFIDHLLPLYVKWLNDIVFEVRKGTAEILPNMFSYFGEQWMLDHIYPHLLDLLKKSNYLLRITGLFCIELLLDKFSISVCESLIMPLLLESCHDIIANVRSAAIRAIRKLKLLNKSNRIEDSANFLKLKQVILKLDKDDDHYVRQEYKMFILGV